MPRRRSADKRVIIPDPKFGDVVVSKLMNNIMERGLKSLAEEIVYGALDFIASKGGNSIEVFHEAVNNVKPFVEVRSRRVGGATYQVPSEVKPARALALSLRWIILASKKRSERSMKLKLACELLDAANKRGNAFKKREETHKMAEANRAFSHYRI